MTPPSERDTAFSQAFAQILRDLRHERGLSQDELAEAAGCHVNHISFLERGLRVPSLLLVFQLAEALELAPGDLVSRIEAAIVKPAR